jgi:4-amino-4-deoxy-L-arabinose transferase-like glycosyltransferase
MDDAVSPKAPGPRAVCDVIADCGDRDRSRPLARRSAATLCAVAIGLFFLMTIREGHVWGDDFSLYIRHAQNIAGGEPYAYSGYIYNPQNPVIGPRLYPPGFPLLLAPVVGAFGLDLRPMKMLVVAFFVGSLLVMISLFSRVLPTWYVTFLVLIVGLNPFFWEFKDQVLSDIPFLFFVLVSLLLFMQAEVGSDPARRVRLVVLCGVAGYAAYATRTLGVTLIPCYLAHDLIRHRRITSNSIIAAAVFAALSGLQYVFWLHDRSYLDTLSNPFAAARQNGPAYLRTLADLWENGYSNVARRIVFLAATTLAAVGFVTSWRAPVSAVQLFPALYFAPVLVWPSYQGMRFLIPILPFYFCFCLLGVRSVAAAAERLGIAKKATLAVFLGAIGVSYGARYTTLQFGHLPEGIGKPESTQLFEFVAASTGPEDVLVFSKPRALALMTGRRVSGPYHVADPCRLWQYMRSIGATYLITGPDSDPFNEEAVYLRQFAARFDSDLRRVMANRDLAVYRIERNPCPPATAPR